jgi:hypothetical protein
MKFIAAILMTFLLVPSAFAVAATGHDFDDVFENDPVNEALDYLHDEGVIEGYSDGTFRPGNFINRAEFVKMIVVGLGLDPNADEYSDCFDDVADEWYARHVCYAKEAGWVQGYGDGNYQPKSNITKVEALAIVQRAFEFDYEDAELSTSFSDVSRSDWFAPYVGFAEENGMLLEISAWLSPHEIISRGQMSEYLYRAMLLGETDFELDEYESELTWEDMLDTGIQAAIPGDYDFPAASQSGYPYGCYGFAMKNLMAYKWQEDVSMNVLASSIGWDGAWIWNEDEFAAFADKYSADVIFNYNAPADYFFKKLERGIPMIVSIPYYIGDENVWHNVVAYSFDEDGVWIADSNGGYTHQIDYDQVFFDSDTKTRNLTELRKVKAGGEKKYQVFSY